MPDPLCSDHVPGTDYRRGPYRHTDSHAIRSIRTCRRWGVSACAAQLAFAGHVGERRIAEVIDFYNTTDLQAALEFLRRYDVQYVVVGDLERMYYSAEGIAKFPRLVEQGKLQELFSISGRVSIYKVRPE
jgi:uncharacterized membrane protein